MLHAIAAALGTTEPAIRLLAVLLAGSPLGALYNLAFVNQGNTLKYLYFALSGAAVCFYGFGLGTLHLIATIAAVYLILLVAHKTKKHVIGAGATFVFTMGYLLWGYFTHATEQYDIDWTTPHCVLTLRLISLAFDLMDGAAAVPPSDSAPLKEFPGPLQVLSYCLYYGGVVVGPQFSFSLYSAFVEGKLVTSTAGRTAAWATRLLLGLVYIAVVAVGMGFYPDEQIYRPEFLSNSFFSRLATVFMVGKINLMKYIGVWLVNESSCILTGISFRAVPASEGAPARVAWDGLSNCSPLEFESTPTLKGVIGSFNINTNHWVMRYIYKRLRFLNNKNLSMLGALLFLAVWHGYYIGYFITFTLEFIALRAEDSLRARVGVPSGPLHYPTLVLAWFARNMVLSYSMITFIGKDLARSHAGLMSLFYCIHIACIAVPFLVTLLPRGKREKPTGTVAAAAVEKGAATSTAAGQGEEKKDK